ncbi:uncharacterized protein BX664DRAFT_317800 [Halteromyces radiatus]|uniref:uncharacterized protein n=1 Tax=Halteromyces radiatus TaxID=101107 RepID=UPI00221E7F8D|nr:uncharacterized protein BX664DRAFT_317800 [Halteromyces radiatus]KAI8079908.1 hypothetical protein BX664DRAFT_317800 [Halteromyces radiatus]
MYRLVLIWVVLFFTWCSAQSKNSCLLKNKSTDLNIFGFHVVSAICDGDHAIFCKSEPIDEICNTHIKQCKNPNYGTAFCKDGYCLCAANATVAGVLTGSKPLNTCTKASECPKCSNKGEKMCKNKKCGCSYPLAKPPGPSSCVDLRQRCDDQKKCCPGLYCIQRSFEDYPTCQHNALSGEDCSSGITCYGTSQCIGGKCSLQEGANCDFDGAVCPYDMHCETANKICTCDRYRWDGTCSRKKRCELDHFGVKELCQCHPEIGGHCYAGSATSEKCKEACFAHRPACETTYTVNLAGLKGCKTYKTDSCKNYYINRFNQTIEIPDLLAGMLTKCGHKI